MNTSGRGKQEPPEVPTHYIVPAWQGEYLCSPGLASATEAAIRTFCLLRANPPFQSTKTGWTQTENCVRCLDPRSWVFRTYLLWLLEKDYGKYLQKFGPAINRRVRGFQCPISLSHTLRGPQTVVHGEHRDEAGKGVILSLRGNTCRI